MDQRDPPKTQTIAEAARALGIGKNQAYAAARRGELPVIRIGKRILVLREPLSRMLAGEAAASVVLAGMAPSSEKVADVARLKETK